MWRNNVLKKGSASRSIVNWVDQVFSKQSLALVCNILQLQFNVYLQFTNHVTHEHVDS